MKPPSPDVPSAIALSVSGFASVNVAMNSYSTFPCRPVESIAATRRR